jgi:peptidoglycan/xylan/chitin deacetylase (PgdA/CDA1 family)
MRVVSPLLKHVVYPGLSRSGYLRRLTSPAPVVLTYHGVLPDVGVLGNPILHDHLVTADVFISQLRLLKSRYNVISPEQFRQWSFGQLQLPSRSVLLTCDDGLLNALKIMLPILQGFGFPCLFFVTGASTSESASMLWFEQLYIWLLDARRKVSIHLPSLPPLQIGREPKEIHSGWLELTRQLSTFDGRVRWQILDDIRTQIGISRDWLSGYSQTEALRNRFFMMNLDELRDLQRTGITIGAHSMSHPMMSKTSEETVFKEMTESKKTLESALEKEVWAFAFPFGTRETAGVREQIIAQKAGFDCAFMSIEEGSVENRFAIPRIHVSLNTSLAEVDAHLSGFYRSARNRFMHR